MHDERETVRSEILPLEARLLLWRRVWERLLAPPQVGGEQDEAARAGADTETGGSGGGREAA